MKNKFSRRVISMLLATVMLLLLLPLGAAATESSNGAVRPKILTIQAKSKRVSARRFPKGDRKALWWGGGRRPQALKKPIILRKFASWIVRN